MDFLKLAWKNLWRSRRRTLITLAAMSLSLMLVQAFHNLSAGVYAQMVASGVRSGSGHLAVYEGDYVQSRDESLSWPAGDLPARVAAIPAVEHALPRIYLPGLAQSARESRGIALTGIDPALEAAVNPLLRHVPEQKMIRDEVGRDALVGEKLLQELQLREGSKFVITVQNREGELVSELFRVRGAIRTGIKDVDRAMVLVGRQRAAAMRGIPGQIHELAVILSDPDQMPVAAAAISALLPPGEDLQVIPWEEAMPNLSNAIRLDYASQKFIFVVILLIVTIGVVNTLLMSVMERVREFGVLLALGTTPGRLRQLILQEALLLGVSSMILGTLLGSGVTWYLAEIGLDLRKLLPASLEFGGVIFDPVLRATWDWPWMLRIGGYVVGLCLLASLYPALKAGRIPPAQAMRHV